jgi:hypothetical protein
MLKYYIIYMSIISKSNRRFIEEAGEVVSDSIAIINQCDTVDAVPEEILNRI